MKVFCHIPNSASTIVSTRLDFDRGRTDGRGRAKLRNDIPLEGVGPAVVARGVGLWFGLVWGQRRRGEKRAINLERERERERKR